MFEFELTEINALGDNDPTYGQRFWCKAAGEEHPISYNTKNPDLLNAIPGTKIVSETKSMKKSSKGTIYWQLKSPKLVEPEKSEPQQLSAPVGAAGAASAFTEEDRKLLQRMDEKLDKLLGLDSVVPVDDEVNLNDIFPE